MKWISRLFSSKGLRGPSLTLLSGSGIVMVIGYLALGVITRLYLPGELGIGKYFVTIMSLVGAIASLRYEDALMLPREDQDAAVLIWLSSAVMLFSAVLLSIFSIWSAEIAGFLEFPAISPYLSLVPLTLICMRSSKIAELWLVRKRAFIHITGGHVGQSISIVSARIAAGAPPISANEAGHIVGFIIGQFVTSTIYIWMALRKSGVTIISACNWKSMIRAAIRYRRFALFSTPSSMIGAIMGHLVVLLIPMYFSSQAAEDGLGFYGIAYAAIAIPISYVARSVAHPFYISAAEAKLSGNLPSITSLVHRRLVMMSLFPVIAVIFAGPDFFELWLGGPHRQTGIYASYIAPWLVLNSISTPLSRVYDITEHQRIDFLMAVLLLVSLSIALILGGQTGNLDIMLLAGGVTGTIIRSLQLVVILRLAGVSWRDWVAPYWAFFVLSLPGVVLICGCLLFENNWVTAGAIILGTASYFGLVIWREKLFSHA